MLYQSYQLQDDFLAPIRSWAGWTQSLFNSLPWAVPESARLGYSAALEMISRFQLTHTRPPFGIGSVLVDGKTLPVEERVSLAKPFANLLHFAKPGIAGQPKVMLIAPLSGHFSTLLRGTVETLLPEHDVYVTDWLNARDVPQSAGRFGVDEYIDYLIAFLEHLGTGAHILAVCQPCVQALAAVAIMSAGENPCVPRSMTLMAGPIDPNESPTMVNELAVKRSLAWFEQSVISQVPYRFAGRGRRVYPGFLQLTAFMAMNMDRHREAHQRMHYHLARGEQDEAGTIKEFYDEYFAVLDMTEEFYLETIDRIFQRAELANGTFTHHGRLVDPAAIRRTALLTVEGGRDDICGMGQTAAAHELCSSLRPHLKRHYLQANVGHYGVFNGSKWRKEIYPVVQNLIAQAS